MAMDGAGAAREEAQRLRDYAEAAADWFWEMDEGLRFTRTSSSSQLPETYSSRSFIGHRIDDVPGLAPAGDDWQPLVEMLEARLPFRDVRLICRMESGGPLHLALSGLPVFDPAGVFMGYRGIGRDLTLLKRAEQELAETTSLLRATLDNIEEGVLVLDAELRIRLWNDRLYQLFAHSPDDLWTDRPVAEMIVQHAGDNVAGAKASISFLRRCIETRRPGKRESVVARGERVVEMRVTPMPDGGLIATYLDITERYRTEADLRRAKEEAELASRSKTEFLANMSHELRTPLNAIIGFSDILKGEVFGRLGDPRYLGYATDIRESGQHLLKLINDVLDVSKVEFGKIELNEEPVDVATVVESCARLMRDRVQAAGLEFSHTLAAGLPLVHCDDLRLKQILLNLLSNAVKFTPPGGRVTVRAALDDKGLGLSVEDTGIGIAAADLAKALRPFGQIDSRLARKYQGTGLGLPLAKSMIELHGGRLEITSTLGVGTKATVWFPPERILFPTAMVGSDAAD
ncbi:MAG TPA: ATP-binding protein [Stellaceae bacterium]|nr:ATP-binding protein [Stellaceae bacterium]